MIQDTTPVFPNNIIDIVQTRIKLLDESLTNSTYRRPLRESDPNTAAGVFAATWEPDTESYEIRGLGSTPAPSEPTISTYVIGVQAFVKDFDEERGLARHSVLSKMIRSMLYRDAPLRVGLSALSVTMNDSVERAQRWGIRAQRYLSNELDGNFLYLSTLEFWLDTETV